MRFLKVLPLFLIPILFYQCQKEINNPGQGNSSVIVGPEPVSARLQGNIFDENDQPAPGVTIKVGSQTAVTDSRGYFSISNAALDKKASLVTAEKAGYFKAYRTWAATNGANEVTIKLIKKTLAGTIDANTGGSVTLTNGTKITLPANGVVKASNSAAYSGTINVYAAYIDPSASDIDQTLPGSFLADNKEGARVVIKSFGILAVELESTSTERLQIKTGSVATLVVPIPSSLISSAPENIPMGYLNEQTGIWNEEGGAVKQGNTYVGDVRHFSWWYNGIPLPSINFTATIKTSTGQVVPYAFVTIGSTASTGTLNGFAYGHADSLGQVSGAIPSGQNLVMTVYSYQCWVPIIAQNIGPFSQNTNLGDIVIPITSLSVVTVTGHLNNCSGASVTNGYVGLQNNYRVRYAATNANGDFSTIMLVCSAFPGLNVFGVDPSNQQQSTTISATLTAPSTNLGIITACGTATTQFLNYTMDGVNYSFNSASPTDTLTMSTNPGGVGVYYTSLWCRKSPPLIDNIILGCSHPAPVAGTYPMYFMRAQLFNNSTLLQPSTITLTNFPQTIGQFYEGSFSGQFKDSVNVTHTVTNGSFRIRKNY